MRGQLPDPDPDPPGVAARTRALCVGLGCTRGAPAGELARAAEAVLRAAGVAPGAVAVVATARRKQDEPALRLWAELLGAAFRVIEDGVLAAQHVVTASARVRAHAGLDSVAEAAALAAAGATVLLLPRRTASLGGGHHLTLAAALPPGAA